MIHLRSIDGVNSAADVARWAILAMMIACTAAYGASPPPSSPFDAGPSDLNALPEVPAGFRVSFFAREPLVRNPCSMAFDAKGRLFVGMGPQYRKPTPETPGDRVVILIDTDGDGIPDRAKTFAEGFNCIQGLAWHGKDLWVANSPDLTIVRDLDGDDEADEYVRVYTDLGNLEHAIHGLNWGPDGKLYMSKGNSKGLTRPEEACVAPKPFRDLWGVTAPPGTPDMPPPQVYRKGQYKHAYHDPRDDWGREGGVLRCDDMGRNLEIVSRGLRNPWDIAFDGGFNWLGTDNDQNEGDRVIMPFYGAHFGWSHAWSPDWLGKGHLPTVPVSGPVFLGSGTGIVYSDVPQFPEAYRGGFFIGDWLLKKIYFYRPRWDGAMIQPEGGRYVDFARGGTSLFRPTDMEIGPDGALYVLGWGRAYGVEWDANHEQANEGRIFRIAWGEAPPVRRSAWYPPKRDKAYAQWTFDELAADLGTSIPVWRVNAQDELVRRGESVKAALLRLVARNDLPEAQQTWALWTLGRIAPEDASIDSFFAGLVRAQAGRPTNVRVQAIRLLAHRVRQFGKRERLDDVVLGAMRDAEPRIRFEAVQAAWVARQGHLIHDLMAVADAETDRATFYSAWHALRDLASPEALRGMLADGRGGVRRAALLALLDLRALDHEEVKRLVGDADPGAASVAALWLAKENGSPLLTFEPPPGEFSVPPSVKVVAAFKPSVVRYTLDGTKPTAKSPTVERSVVLKSEATLRAAIFVDGKQVGPAAEAVYRQAKPDAELAATGPAAVKPLAKATTVADAMPLLGTGDAARGRAVFFGRGGAGCFNCHRVRERGTSYGPELTGIGGRNDPAGLVQSILEPNAQIVEGFGTLLVVTKEGDDYMGVLREETDTALTLVQGGGGTVRIDKASIAERRPLHSSSMPDYSQSLTPQQVADLVAWLMLQK
jgi:putative membrane-bound dehydrogenase-like protein